MTDNSNSSSQKRGTDSDSNQPQRQPTSDANHDTSTNTDHAPTIPPNSSAAADNGSSASLAGRIQNSAQGLARSAFSASSSASDAAHLLPGGSSGSKAGPSTSSRAAFSAAQQFEDSGASAPSSSAREHSHGITGETFRSSSTTENQHQQGGFTLPSFSEAEFQSSYGDDPWADSYTDRQTLKGKTAAPDPDTDESPETLLSSTENLTIQSPTPVPLPLATDGSAITNLLSSPSFDPEFPPQPHEPFSPVETDLSEPPAHNPLTAEEIQMIESFRRQMTPPAPQSHRLTPYSLVPDIDTILNSAAVWGPGADATALRDTVLDSLPGSAEWVSMDEKYHDEVWGYLRPTLEAAREEMQERERKGGEGAGEDGPAVRRLKMILKHMGG
ncbi:hypothetical protein P170DRAFT_435929 [Aspergillus steynii IBT 23096]|uniref:Uncharacterized protein n=1 Tax=Aspergillus steynii IBT 23096 TaxID=1392250 RepID=A0A2I2GD04_9EURO|nr:uncharacterized protein P170DRAFT_435929 [Aspergillus steynii IBT 23096]PLB50753.1 hypothetical protein P170DRAFT_435929 [Aspergillus steynii IBT 23096]